MGNIIQQRIDESGVYIRTSKGTEFNASVAELRTFLMVPERTAVQRKSRFLNRLRTVCGADMVDVSAVNFESDEQGTPLEIEA